MEYENLFASLRVFGTISDDEENNIKKYFNVQKIKKNEILIEKNSPCNKLFFINDGLIRAYYINDKGNEVTRMIAWKNRFLTNIINFRNFADNLETIECIENGELLVIVKDDFIHLMQTSTNLKSIYGDILEEYNAMHIKRFQQLNTLLTRDKMIYFNQNFPTLRNRISDNVLSSFLAISRKTLERIKKN